jgi:hypothetical protein
VLGAGVGFFFSFYNFRKLVLFMTSVSSRTRWYDEDPALSRVLESLKSAPDEYHAKVALNILKVIAEHQLERPVDEPEQLESFAEQVMVWNQAQRQALQHRRWYDINDTLSAAMNMLESAPPDIRQQLIPGIVGLIESALGPLLVRD